MSLQKKNLKRPQESKIRIIGGHWRGRKLVVNDAEGLRPTSDRLRETLFNWLAPTIGGARCLDAFAGTGALGFEALSRGAAFTEFVELNPTSAARLRDNVATLEASAQVSQTDFLHVNTHLNNDPFDLVFIDPPFAFGLWQEAIDHIDQKILLSDHAQIYVEAARGETYCAPPHWQQVKNKSIGQVSACLFEVPPSLTDAGHEGIESETNSSEAR